MSARIVMLGPIKGGKIQAREVTPNDAAAYVNGGNWRVFFSLYDGELADATVLMHTRLWSADTPAKKKALLTAWRAVEQLSPRGIALEFDLPLSCAECRAS